MNPVNKTKEIIRSIIPMASFADFVLIVFFTGGVSSGVSKMECIITYKTEKTCFLN